MAIETLVKTTFSDAFRDELWQDLSAGKLLTPDFKKNIKIGDEVNVQFHDHIDLIDYDGSDLDISTVKVANTSTVKVKINKGKAVFFRLDEQKVRQIESAKTNEERIKLVKEYSSDAREQFARAINASCCQEGAIRAGLTVNSTSSAITVTADNVHKIFAEAKKKLKQGDQKGHTAWAKGKMLAIISTDMEAFMSTQNLLQYSDTMAKHYKTGFAGMFMGFNVIVDDDIYKDNDGYEYPLFGREGKTLAGGIQDEFTLESGKQVGGFNTHYWGKGVYGVKLPLAYLLCTAKLNCNFTVS